MMSLGKQEGLADDWKRIRAAADKLAALPPRLGFNLDRMLNELRKNAILYRSAAQAQGGAGRLVHEPPLKSCT